MWSTVLSELAELGLNIKISIQPNYFTAYSNLVIIILHNSSLE